MVVSGCRKSWGKNGYEVSFKGDKNVPKFIIVMTVLLCEYTMWIILFKCELSVNKDVDYLSKKKKNYYMFRRYVCVCMCVCVCINGILLCTLFCNFFWPHCAACSISVPWSRIEPRPWQWKPRILTTRPTGNSLQLVFNLMYHGDSSVLLHIIILFFFLRDNPHLYWQTIHI